MTDPFAHLDGARLPGDCPSCNAEDVITANTGGPGVHLVRVEHDPDCSWLAEQRRKQRQQQWCRRSPRAHRPKDDDAR